MKDYKHRATARYENINHENPANIFFAVSLVLIVVINVLLNFIA